MSLTTLEPDSLEDKKTGIWDYISPSRLNCWLSCPLKFKLRYIDGIRSPPNPALFLGKQVHAGLECYYRHRQLGVTLAAAEVTKRLFDEWGQAVAEEQMTFATVADEAALRNQAAQLVTKYLEQVSNEECRPLAVESTLEAPLVNPQTGENLGIRLLGVVDLILDELSGPTIVDFKTSSKSSPPFAVTHEIQLSCYSYLFRNLSGQEEGGLEVRSLIKTKQTRVEIHHYAARSNHHQRRLFSVIKEYLDCLDAGTFNYRPGWGCSMCDYREGPCAAWAG